MAEFLEAELGSIAFCWRIVRRDGVCLGFTTHDGDLEMEGLLYRAAPGVAPSAVSLSDGFEPASLDIAGALSADAISATDLAAGRWDGAVVELFMVDWTAPAGERLALARGELGEVSLKGAAFEAELKGPTALLDRPVVELTSPTCRASLGDKRCRVDMAPRTRVTRIAALLEENVVEVESAAGGNAYAYGRLRWIGGANSGLEAAIVASAGVRLTLREAPHFAPAVGDLVEIAEGCDRSFATCSGRFANAVNFRGEPHLPGMDLLTRYPGA